MTTPTDATALVARVREFVDIVENCDQCGVRFNIDGTNTADLYSADLRALLSLVAQGEADRERGPVVTAFIAPNNHSWQGVSVNVTADGSWWRFDPTAESWVRDTPPLPATPTEGPTHG